MSLPTGYIATMDEDGYFKIVDHKNDMILGAGGYNVYPREIGDVLSSIPRCWMRPRLVGKILRRKLAKEN